MTPRYVSCLPSAVILSKGEVCDEWNVEFTEKEFGQCAVGTEHSEVAAEKVSASGKKKSEWISLAIADFKKISPRVRYAVSCEGEKIGEAPRVSAVKIAEEVVSSGAKKLITLPAEGCVLSHMIKGGE